MNVYGPLVVGEEAYKNERIAAEVSAGSVYGKLVVGEAVVAAPAPAGAEPVAPAAVATVNGDLTVAELTDALGAAPLLAKAYLDAELARAAGVRKGALVVIRDVATASGDTDTAKLAADTLAAVG
ncbi:MAG: hypothetical protein ACK5VI_10870 [Opitutia bacterium]|jgi:hypothetical protein